MISSDFATGGRDIAVTPQVILNGRVRNINSMVDSKGSALFKGNQFL